MCIICTTKREFVCKCSEAAATAVWIREGLLNCNCSWMCERTCVHNLCHSWPTLGRIPKSVDWSSACLRWDGSAVLRTYVNQEWARAGHPCISSEYELDLSCCADTFSQVRTNQNESFIIAPRCHATDVLDATGIRIQKGHADFKYAFSFSSSAFSIS